MELSLTGIVASLLTGLALACFYMLNKTTATAGRPMQVIFWIFAMHLPVLCVYAALSWPLRVMPAYFLPGVGVLVATVAGNLLTIRALSLSPFSLMVPVMGLSPVFASILAIPLLQEWPSGTQTVGISLAVLGVLWLYAPAERPWDILSFWPGFMHERGAVSMIAAAFCWALGAPLDRLALRQADPAFHALFVFTGLVIVLLIWLSLRGEWRAPGIPRPHWRIIAVTGFIGAVADILQLLALQHTPAGPFEAIKRVVSQLAALALGTFFFREQLTVPKVIGIGILSLGVPMIVM